MTTSTPDMTSTHTPNADATPSSTSPPSAPYASHATPDPTAYYNQHIPPSLHTVSPPDFLANCNPKDIGILSTPDSQYPIQTWPIVKDIIARNQLQLFQRRPSELRRYLEFCWNLKKEYGSVLQFIKTKRLGWDDLKTENGVKDTAPESGNGKTEVDSGEESKVGSGDNRINKFEDPSNWKILYNDWPYGIEEKIVHLVVWTKFELEEDPESPIGDLTEEARREIEGFVEEKFVRAGGMPKDDIIWFKNWKSLKSVHAIEHFHVMLYDPNPEFIAKVTNGDIPYSKRV